MHKSAYASFLVRLWWRDGQPTSHPASPDSAQTTLSKEEEEFEWRITALNPQTGEQWGFATLEQLLRFLQEQQDALPTAEKKISGDQ